MYRHRRLTAEMVMTMAKDPIGICIHNHTGDHPDDAKAGGAKVIATGRSDYPNQINNNSLHSLGIFRGTFDVGQGYQ